MFTNFNKICKILRAPSSQSFLTFSLSILSVIFRYTCKNLRVLKKDFFKYQKYKISDFSGVLKYFLQSFRLKEKNG